MLQNRFPNSLAFRLMAITLIWVVFALVLTALLLSTYFKNNAEQEFRNLLLAHTYNLMGAIDADKNDVLSGSPNLGDPRFLQPSSGWYWYVTKANNSDTPLLHSDSVTGEQISIVSVEDQPFDDKFQRYLEIENDSGNTVQRLEAQLLVGESNELFQVTVAGNKKSLFEAVSQFQRTLFLFFGLFGLGSMLATYFVVLIGLAPLRRVTNSLQDVREGRSDLLKGQFPNEIQPMATEINALIKANRSIVERARTQVGNLAHALKTPLAVILNETEKPGESSRSTIDEQIRLMRSQMQSYLDRARIAAQKNVLGNKTDLSEVLNRLVRVMQKLSPDIEFEMKITEPNLMFKGEQQDLEEAMGNLLENASRFANNRVLINVQMNPSNAKSSSQLLISVNDDGPGLSLEERKKAVKRGIRLDETQPGSGLGLSIVRDIAEEYEGSFHLETSSLGGLEAVLILPRVLVN